MPISKEQFRAALSNFPSGVTVVTTKDADGRLHGITVSAFSSVSLDPPMILVCVDKRAGSHDALLQSRAFVVHILAEDHAHHSKNFASRNADKFAGIEYRKGISEIPVLENVLVTLECRLAHAHEGGDHTIFVGEIEKAEVREGNPLIYWKGDYRKLDTPG
jgi:flavin reductase (DIM6/NTAB) family NADH-FMN oxidoreductase RutF